MAKITKTIRLRVENFVTEDWNKLAKELYAAKDDLRIAANRLMCKLYAERRFDLEPKVKSNLSYCYQLITGKSGDCVYDYSVREVAGGIKSALASKVYDRYKTDRKDVSKGTKSLASFKDIPIPVRKQEVKIKRNKSGQSVIYLSLWSQYVQDNKKKNSERVVLSVKTKGKGDSTIWQRILSGVYSHGSAELTVDNKKRWWLNLTYSFEVQEKTNSERALGVDLGMVDLASCAIYDISHESFISYESFSPPEDIWQLFQRDMAFKRQIGKSNRDEYNLRSGHGRRFKNKPLDKIYSKYRNRVDDIINKTVNAIVKYAMKHDCSFVAIEDLSWSNKKLMDDTEGLEKGSKRWQRNYFLRSNQGTIRQKLKSKCAEHGLTIIEVDAKYTSQICSECGSQQQMTENKNGKTMIDKDGLCYRDGKRFSCKCGTYTKKGSCDSDINAARNIVLRAKEVINVPVV